jgi:hypothetical protein
VRTPLTAAERTGIAWHGLLTLAGGLTALLLAVAGRYGYHRDELYFIRAGSEPAFGYADQPPLTPLLAVALDTSPLARSWSCGRRRRWRWARSL